MARFIVVMLAPLALCLDPAARFANYPKTNQHGVCSPEDNDHVSLLQTRASMLNVKEAVVVARQAVSEAHGEEKVEFSEGADRDEAASDAPRIPIGFGTEAGDVFAASYGADSEAGRTRAERGGDGAGGRFPEKRGSGERILAEQQRSLAGHPATSSGEVRNLQRAERRVAQLRRDQAADEFRASEDGLRAFDDALQELRTQNEEERREEAGAQVAHAASTAPELRDQEGASSVAEDRHKETDAREDAGRAPTAVAEHLGKVEGMVADVSKAASVASREQPELGEGGAPEDGTEAAPADHPVSDSLLDRLRSALESRVAEARGTEVTQSRVNAQNEDVDVETRSVDTRDRGKSGDGSDRSNDVNHGDREHRRPALASYVRDAGRACGECGSDSNNLKLGSGEDIFDAATRETAAVSCGGVCDRESKCAGFVFSNATQRCYYKADTACQALRDLDHDCFTKADLWVPPADALVPDADEESHDDDFNEENGSGSKLSNHIAKKPTTAADAGEGLQSREHHAEHSDAKEDVRELATTKAGAMKRGKRTPAEKRGRVRTHEENEGHQDVQEKDDVRSFDDVVLKSKLFSSGASSSQAESKKDTNHHVKGRDQKGSKKQKDAMDQRVAKQRKPTKSHVDKGEQVKHADKGEFLDTEPQMRNDVRKAIGADAIKAGSKKKTRKTKQQSEASKSKQVVNAEHGSKDLKSEHGIQKAIDQVKQQIKELKREKLSASNADHSNHKSTESNPIDSSTKDLKLKEGSTEKKTKESKSKRDQKIGSKHKADDAIESSHPHESKASLTAKKEHHSKDVKKKKASRTKETKVVIKKHTAAGAKERSGKDHISITKASHRQAKLDVDILSGLLADGVEVSSAPHEGEDHPTLDSVMAPWAVGEKDSNTCPEGYSIISTEKEGREAATFFKANIFPDFVNSARNDRPNGCFKWVNSAFYFNPREMPAQDPHGTPVCKRLTQEQVSFSGSAHTMLARSHGSLKVAGDFYIVNAEHKKYLLPTDDGVSLWRGSNDTLSDLGSVPDDLRWRLASKPGSPSYLLGNLGRSVYLTAFSGHVNTHTPHGASQLNGKNGSVLSWQMELVPNATDLYYISFGSKGQYLDSDGGPLAAWGPGSEESSETQTTVRAPPKSAQWQLVRVTESAVCNDYMVSSGCGWTEKWNCPGQDGGNFGSASSHGGGGSQGYNCCCELQMHARALPDVPRYVLPEVPHADAQTGRMTMAEQDQRGADTVKDMEGTNSSRAELVNDLKMRIEQLEKASGEGDLKSDEEAIEDKEADKADKEIIGKNVAGKFEENAVEKKAAHEADKMAINKV